MAKPPTVAGDVPPTKRKFPALEFEILKRCKTSRARRTRLILPHGVVDTPVFMPVGTQGAIKALTMEEVAKIGYQIILANTYHLGLRPTTKVIDNLGGLHKFTQWSGNFLTDSGGFQMVSLLKLAKITEEGVTFKSPIDGSPSLLTPEESIRFQNEIGADIIMQLDDVVPAVCKDDKRFREGCERSIRWLDRCIKAHKRPNEQNLFGIVQGGLDISKGGLREQNIKAMLKRADNLPGFAVGGLAGGETKDEFWKVVDYCAQRIPWDKPRYVMGVGYPVDLVVCSALGMDMFDCVYGTRMGRFNIALLPTGPTRLNNHKYLKDFRPLDEHCQCPTCKKYTRAFLHNRAATCQTLCSILSCHNLTYLFELMKGIREAISDDRFPDFVKSFMWTRYHDEYPEWVVNALSKVGIDLEGDAGFAVNSIATL